MTAPMIILSDKLPDQGHIVRTFSNLIGLCPMSESNVHHCKLQKQKLAKPSMPSSAKLGIGDDKFLFILIFTWKSE